MCAAADGTEPAGGLKTIKLKDGECRYKLSSPIDPKPTSQFVVTMHGALFPMGVFDGLTAQQSLVETQWQNARFKGGTLADFDPLTCWRRNQLAARCDRLPRH